MVLNPMDVGLSKQELFGQIQGNKFIVHKLPMHVIQIYQAFGCGEQRLRGMHYQGVREGIILFHPNREETECYTVDISKWLEGIAWENKLRNGRIERQRLVLIADCKQS